MTDLEDLLRRTMTAHEHEAPPADVLHERLAADAPARRPLSPTWLLAGLAAATVAALAIGLAVVGAHRDHPRQSVAPPPGTAPASPLICPATVPTGVPAPPTVPAAADRLVPDEVPRSAVVCAYRHGGSHPNPGSLTGSRALGGDLRRIPEQLTSLPRSSATSSPCTANLTLTDLDHYLVGLTYPTGVLWVDVPGNHCDGSSNGVFDTRVNLGLRASMAFDAGLWPDA